MSDPFEGLPRGRFQPTHGHTGTPTYVSWLGMFKRCKPYHMAFKNYGGRGIFVCERWQKFENFLADMGERPQGATLDRYPDNNGSYEPSNCRWATPVQQHRNKRNNLILKAGDKSMCLSEWMERSKVSRRTVSRRLKKGWPIDRAISEPDRRGRRR